MAKNKSISKFKSLANEIQIQADKEKTKAVEGIFPTRRPTAGGAHDHNSFQAYKAVQQQVKKSVKQAKRNLERRLAKNRKKNSKGFYSYIKKKTKNKVTVGPLKDKDVTVSDDEAMANLLNKWYCSVFTEEDLTNIPLPENMYEGDEPLVTVHFTAGKVKKKLEELKPTAAPGPDKIWARVLNDLAEVLSAPLA